jgi:transposase-like protein
MEIVEVLSALEQAKSVDFEQELLAKARAAARHVLTQAMSEEVTALCGDKYRPAEETDCVRAGSAPGSVYLDSGSEKIIRPRVRKMNAEGASEEVQLASYQAAQNEFLLMESILEAMQLGVSTRSANRVTGTKHGCSKSAVSRQWKEMGAVYFKELRERSLADNEWVVLMLDGVFLNNEIAVIVALGIDREGRKHMLDFEVGSSENSELVDLLLQRIKARGFKPLAKHLLIVLDGSDALRKGVRTHWPKAPVQTCLVHLQRVLHRKLAHKHHADLERLMKNLREASNLKAAEEAFDALYSWTEKISDAATESLKAAGKEMLTLFTLGVSDLLNKSLLSTNCIENSILSIRRSQSNIKRWRSVNGMINRWMSFGLLEAEKSFHRIKGYQVLDSLIDGLNKYKEKEESDKIIAVNESADQGQARELAANAAGHTPELGERFT